DDQQIKVRINMLDKKIHNAEWRIGLLEKGIKRTDKMIPDELKAVFEWKNPPRDPHKTPEKRKDWEPKDESQTLMGSKYAQPDYVSKPLLSAEETYALRQEVNRKKQQEQQKRQGAGR